MEISFPKEVAKPGGGFVVLVILHVTRACACNDVVVRLHGSERRFLGTRSDSERNKRLYHRREVIERVRKLPAQAFEVGTHKLEARFLLPTGLPPSYSSDWSDIEYVASVEVDVVGWLNARAERPFTVAAATVQPAEKQALRCATSDQPEGTALYIEASIPQRDYRYSDTIRGDLAIWNGAHHAIKFLELGLAAIERPLLGSTHGPAVTDSSAVHVIETPKEGDTVPFELKVHRDLGFAFRTPFIEVSHALIVRAVLSLASDVELRLPIRLVRPAAAIVPARRAGYVGLERARYAWKKARAALEQEEGVVIDGWSASDRRGSFTLAGTRVTLSFEDGRNGGHTSVTVDYPDLGLGLRLTERRWSHVGRGLDLPLHDDRFFVIARDAEQARTFLTRPLLEALAFADEVALDDEVAVISLRESLRTRSSLESTLAAAIQVTRAAQAAYAATAPPTAHTRALPFYRAFAEAHGAQLRVGDLSLYGLTLRGLLCRLQQRFAGAKIAATSLLVTLPFGLEPTSDKLTRLEANLGSPVEQRGRELAIERPPVDDPALVLPLWEAFAEEVMGWSRGAVGPYRG